MHRTLCINQNTLFVNHAKAWFSLFYSNFQPVIIICVCFVLKCVFFGKLLYEKNSELVFTIKNIPSLIPQQKYTVSPNSKLQTGMSIYYSLPIILVYFKSTLLILYVNLENF